MTTVAFDGTTLAVDRQGTYANSRFEVCKLRRCGKYMFAGSGSTHEVATVEHWLAAGARLNERPELEDAVSGIAVDARGKAFLVGGKRPCLIPLINRMAVGSGSEAASAAMDFGKNAIEAIEYASKVDISTGLGVDSYTVKRPKK